MQNNAIDFKFFVQEKHVYLYAITCSLRRLDVKINHMKIFKIWNFQAKSYKGIDSFKNHLTSCLYS
jgi:hypothetical protein